MKYYLIAGEASGDLHGSHLIKTLKQQDTNAVFRFFGGDLMKAQDNNLVKHYADMAYMGFWEVIINLKSILKNLSYCKKDIVLFKPDVLILIDFPGFNLKIAEFAKANKIKVAYYISPKVWAWNQKRVLKIKKVVDKMYCILPFEVDFYKNWGMEVEYVGNPLLDAIEQFNPQKNFKNIHELNSKPIIALLPGSRKQELKYILPEMLKVVPFFPEYQFIIAGAPSFKNSFYDEFIKDIPVKVLFNVTYDLLHQSHAALVTSGTATLETALFNIPQVVLYKGNNITIAIARMLVNIKFISLVNLVMDKGIVKELIQEECNENLIRQNLHILLQGEARERMLQEYQILAEQMGSSGASQKVAKSIYKWLSQSLS